jgi:hypothetical protein
MDTSLIDFNLKIFRSTNINLYHITSNFKNKGVLNSLWDVLDYADESTFSTKVQKLCEKNQIQEKMK